MLTKIMRKHRLSHVESHNDDLSLKAPIRVVFELLW